MKYVAAASALCVGVLVVGFGFKMIGLAAALFVLGAMVGTLLFWSYEREDPLPVSKTPTGPE